MTATAQDTASVIIVPHSRGLWGRASIKLLWEMVEEEDAAAQIFYAQSCEDETWRGDLIEFVRYFMLDTTRRALFVPVDSETGRAMGLVWFDEITPGYLGAIGVFYRKAFRGAPAINATRHAVQHAFTHLGYQRLAGFTPHLHAMRHIVAAGWHRVATLPGFTRIKGTPRDMHVATITKEEWKLCQAELLVI